MRLTLGPQHLWELSNTVMDSCGSSGNKLSGFSIGCISAGSLILPLSYPKEKIVVLACYFKV